MTTVTPRYLSEEEYCDPRSLLVHCSFEILLQFLEEEAGTINWESDHEHANVIAIMKQLAQWYELEFIPYENYENQMILHDMQPEPISMTQIVDGRCLYRPRFESEDEEMLYRGISQAVQEYEIEMEREIIQNLNLLADVRPFMWS